MMMSERVKVSMSFWVDLAFKLAVVAGPAMLIWLKSQFVTKDELETEREQRRKLSESVLRISEAMHHDEAQDSRIADHESRLRILESRSFSGGSLDSRK